GTKPARSHWSYGWEGAGSRMIRKPGNLIQAFATASFRGKGVYVMWRRFSLLSTAMPLIGLTAMADVVCAADPPDLVQQLLERIRVLEERLDRLERVEVIKKAVEYVCPGGEILDQPPPNGRCPEGSRPQVRETVRKSTVSRRESIGEKIEAALQEAEAKKVAVGGAARGGVQQVINGRDGQNKLFGEGSLDVTVLARPMART